MTHIDPNHNHDPDYADCEVTHEDAGGTELIGPAKPVEDHTLQSRLLDKADLPWRIITNYPMFVGHGIAVQNATEVAHQEKNPDEIYGLYIGRAHEKALIARWEAIVELVNGLRDAASALASPPTRFVWLLERTVPNGPRYYDGTTNGTADPLKAVQFARKQDAEWGQARVPYGSTCWTVVEHGFMSALASPQEHDERTKILRDGTALPASTVPATASADEAWEEHCGECVTGTWCERFRLCMAGVIASDFFSSLESVTPAPARILKADGSQETGSASKSSSSGVPEGAAPGAQEGLAARLLAWEENSRLGYTERFEREAEAFYRATGFMAPGKSVPMEMAATQGDEARDSAWRTWSENRQEQFRKDMRDAASALVPLPGAAARYQDAGLPLATEVYGFLDALGMAWSHDDVAALTAFIQGRIGAPVPSPPDGWQDDAIRAAFVAGWDAQRKGTAESGHAGEVAYAWRDYKAALPPPPQPPRDEK
jgi:hypothetical protein